MARSTVHYADNKTNNILKALHNKLRPAGTPVQRVEYIIELLLLRIFEVRVKRDEEFKQLRKLFEKNDDALVFSDLLSRTGNEALETMNKQVFPFYGNILGKARTVYANKNLPQKVQDQLVLIEEVFSNSNFSNNVKNGNLHEILGLVSDIDEERLLKTDLLGDAIESALSEQGGTKDVGLYRTPDHVRQMMVAMVDPDFKDTIFDPACGTGGFLFDAFQYVIEKAGKDENWPSERSHKEIKAYFKKYFSKIESEMPSNSMANTFYRVGISGIEYLGMIRKMAAINLYIRGLNPANIEQGDSLDLYNPNVETNDKSVVIANPPFGAKLDQPAYPNVWEEYPKTDSTTLFVKLMFNHLKTGGKCAVVVSEGFLTWDNEAAREMRKLLLEEASLKAIISLPQGVFVSKNGQGAKTSILYFEKGEPTKNIWFYRITNDGYSMGVNRKEISGCQVPEILELFTKYIKHGKIPPKTKNSFAIPAEWIKQIDPRLKERIKNEVAEQQKEKFSEKRKAEVGKLEEKLKKGKIDKKEYDEKILQLDNAIENNIQNEIAKRIEKAHAYSFNIQNYRSSLTDSQIEKWRGAFGEIKVKNGENIESRYQSLYKSGNGEALQILASFNPESALEMDIAREYLSKLENKNKQMSALEDILKEAQKFPFESLSNLLKEKSEKVVKVDNQKYKQVTIRLYGKGVELRQEILGEEIKTDSQYKVSAGNFIMSKIDARNGAFGIVPENLDGAIVTSSFPYFEINTDLVNPSFLNAIVTQPKFYDQINEMVAGATGRRSVEVDDFLQLQIPLPPLEVQEEIVEKIRRQKEIIEGAEKIENNFLVDFNYGKYPIENVSGYLDTLTDFTANGSFASLKENVVYKHSPDYAVLIRLTDLRNDINGNNNLIYVDKHAYDFLKKSALTEGNFLIANVGANVGEVMLMPKIDKPATLGPNMYLVKFNESKLLTKYVYCVFNTEYVKQQIKNIAKVSAQPKINKDDFKSIKIPVPSIEIQKQIIAQSDKEIEALKNVRELKNQSEERVNKILDEIWGNNKQKI